MKTLKSYLTCTAMAAATVMATSVAVAADKPPLRDVKELDDGVYIVGLAHEIRKACPTISGRLFKGMAELRRLYDRAIELGYTRAQVKAHVESDVEKDRLRARAAKEMKARGFAQDSVGYCALGRDEIAKKTNVGALLRVTN